jgi:putative membrane protein
MIEPIPEQSRPPSTDIRMISADDPRVILAAERTLLAWIRTGLSMMGFGFLVAKFGLFLREIVLLKGGELSATPHWSLWIGAAMVVLGGIANLVAGVEHLRYLKNLPENSNQRHLRSRMGVTSAFTLAAIGLLMVAYLIAL